MSMQVRCIDAAREAARLAARGAAGVAAVAAPAIEPVGADLAMQREGVLEGARVSAHSYGEHGDTVGEVTVCAVDPGVR